MASDPRPGERINLFSLVTYLPEPPAEFIHHHRQELVPGCSLRAHVTHLVPRPLEQEPRRLGVGRLVSFGEHRARRRTGARRPGPGLPGPR